MFVKKLFLVSLGCPKNLVDSENIVGNLGIKGVELVASLEEADAVLINTCSFIKTARDETYREIESLCSYKKTYKRNLIIIVIGCALKNIGKKSLMKKFPEVDYFFEFEEYDKVASIIGNVENKKESIKKYGFRKAQLTPFFYSYVKISEGCSNNCSYCIIPAIRGNHRSFSDDKIVREVKELVSKGVKEINLIAQDLTMWGKDFSKGKNLIVLLKKLLKTVKGDYWIRLLYLHPKGIDRELIDMISSEEKICPYIDMPIQHINDRILEKMNRHVKRRDIEKIIEYARSRNRMIFFRTSVIVGFPGEGKKEFNELLDFITKAKFERLGAFVYSKEKGTSAYAFDGHVPSKEKNRRYNELMKKQSEIAFEISKVLIGKKLRVLVSGEAKGGGFNRWGRSQYDAPDIDPIVFLKNCKKCEIGKFVEVSVTAGIEYDLIAEKLKKKE